MKLVTFTIGNETRVGVVINNDSVVVDLAAAGEAAAVEAAPQIFADMISLLEAGEAGLAAAAQAVAAAGGGEAVADDNTVRALNAVTLQAPVPCPRKVLALAGNYRDHIIEGGAALVPQDEETPRVFMKPPATTVIGAGDSIRIPPVAQSIDWEGELAVVIGRPAKAVKAAAALQYVAGYTIMNDVSERNLKIWERSDSRPQDKWFDWLNGKWFDTFAPQGPWIVTRDEIPDPQTLEISTFVNGERKQHSSTAQMIFSVARVIEYISAMVMLQPGDLISTGTVAGVGNASGTYLQPGDDVRIEISGIGALRNIVVKSDS